MAHRPRVSVVTAVYNGEEYLRQSLESILGQRDVEFEFIIVDDGSTDRSPEMLAEMACQDPRVRLFRQPNLGLTAALICGCSKATGEFIARHDADDISLPGRLQSQADLLARDHQCAFVSCWSRAIGPCDEFLYEEKRTRDPLKLRGDLVSGKRGPAGHGSVMFRSSAYEAIGGYREAFRVAQDYDLWLRLIEVGTYRCLPELLYAYRVAEHSISAHRRDAQQSLSNVARSCYEARQADRPETDLLAEAARISALPESGREQNSNAYFIGRCLFDRRDLRAKDYLWRSIRNNPWRWRSWACLVLAQFRCR